MCGRYSLTTPVEALRSLFHFEQRPNLGPRYNIAPTQDAPVVIEDNGRRLVTMRWGLVPFFAKDPGIGNRLINARSETAARLPAFRAAFRRRRCLVPADGFYEWRKDGKTKQPFRIVRKDHGPFAMAGLWERWDRDGGEGELLSFTILTTDANALVAPLHDRMPVILPEAGHAAWLDPAEDAAPLLVPHAGDDLEAYPVARHVGNPRHDDPTCIEPLPDAGRLL
jgi:putative SOS response-associated peptidase YedK